MSRTYRNIGQWDIEMLEDQENWKVPVNHETTWRGRRWLGNDEWSEVQTFTRQVRYGDFVPPNVRRYKLRKGRRPLGRDGQTNCGCRMCGAHSHHCRQMNRRHRHQNKAAIKRGRWDDLPIDYMNDWCD